MILTFDHIVTEDPDAKYFKDRRRRVYRVIVSYNGEDGEYRKAFEFNKHSSYASMLCAIPKTLTK